MIRLEQAHLDAVVRRLEDASPSAGVVARVLWYPLTLGLMGRDLEDWLYRVPSWSLPTPAAKPSPAPSL